MSAAGRSEDTPDHVAARLRTAEFVRLVATADGDALAATGLLARALEECGVPYQASLAAVPEPPATDADCTVGVGHASPGGKTTRDITLRETPLSVTASDIAGELADTAVDPMLALAGAVSAGVEPSGRLLEAAATERQPGAALPTTDWTVGLAGTALVHAAFSGDEDVAAAMLDGVDDPRNLASLVALSAVEDAPPRAPEAVDRALPPSESYRFQTLGGFADVLDAVARVRPGTGIALALGHDVESTALTAWQAHGRAVHTALRTADTGRYDGVSVARVDGLGAGERPDELTSRHGDAPLLGTVARLSFEYRSLEPVALAVTDGAAAAVGEAPVEEAIRAATTALGGRSTARDSHGTATFDGTATDFVAAFREAL
jgi:hypothetical protein